LTIKVAQYTSMQFNSGVNKEATGGPIQS